MASTVTSPTTTLPYGTTSDNIVKLLNAIKNKQGDDKGIRATYTGTKFETTQTALETLGIISGLELTTLGKSIAFESDENKRKIAYLKAVLGYTPYEYFLSFITQSTTPTETDIETLKNFWGKSSFGTANNRSEAATVFFSILQLSGLGEYIIGRKGKKTRFVWASNYSEIIKRMKPEYDMSSEEEKTLQEEATEINIEKAKNAEMDEHILTTKNDLPVALHRHINAIMPTNIEIKVDMTEWEIEKISSFLKIINGESV